MEIRFCCKTLTHTTSNNKAAGKQSLLGPRQKWSARIGRGWEEVLSDLRQEAGSEYWRTGANIQWLGVNSNY